EKGTLPRDHEPPSVATGRAPIPDRADRPCPTAEKSGRRRTSLAQRGKGLHTDPMEEAMTDTTSAPTKPPEPTDAAPAPESRPAPPARSAPKHAGSELGTDESRTSIADSVVAKIAGVAAREVSGVHAMGGGASRAFGAIREAVGTSSASQGVSVEVGERQAAIDLTLVVEYGA